MPCSNRKSSPSKFREICHRLALLTPRSNEKAALNDLEQEFNKEISRLTADSKNVFFTAPKDIYDKYYARDSAIGDEITQANSVPEATRLSSIKQTYKTNVTALNQISAKALQKDRFHQKITEEIIYLLFLNRYFRRIGELYRRISADGKITANIISNNPGDGLILTPGEISSILEITDFDFQIYLIALLKLVDFILEYSTNCIILISTDTSSDITVKSQYSLCLLNLNLIRKLQDGFQILDLKNDAVRRKYDGLKYSFKKLNGIVYDLSLRHLIEHEVVLD